MYICICMYTCIDVYIIFWILSQVFYSIEASRSLALIVLTVCAVYMAVFEYQKQVIFKMTVFDGEPLLSYWHLLLVSHKKNVVFGISKASFFFQLHSIKSSSKWLFLTVNPCCPFDTCFWYPTKRTSFLEYQKQVIFQLHSIKSSSIWLLFFYGGGSLSYWHLLLVFLKRTSFWNTKSRLFFNLMLCEGGSWCQTKNCVQIRVW